MPICRGRRSYPAGVSLIQAETSASRPFHNICRISSLDIHSGRRPAGAPTVFTAMSAVVATQ